MARYRVSINGQGFDNGSTVDSIDDAAALLRSVGFEPASVWRHDARAKHWNLIFDTSLASGYTSLPPSLYWCNVAQNERGAT